MHPPAAHNPLDLGNAVLRLLNDRVANQWFDRGLKLETKWHLPGQHDSGQIVLRGNPKMCIGRATPAVFANVAELRPIGFLDDDGNPKTETHARPGFAECQRMGFVRNSAGCPAKANGPFCKRVTDRTECNQRQLLED